MKLQQMPNGQYILTIPIEIIKGFGWNKHDVIEHKITGQGKLEISKRANQQ